MKTSELIDEKLDWAVLEASGAYREYVHWREAVGDSVLSNPIWFKRLGGSPSTNWSQGGPIIEREKINIGPKGVLWWSGTASNSQDGPTPLIAAMRCYVASKLGDEVEIPKELL
jgi:hypothetical protein